MGRITVVVLSVPFVAGTGQFKKFEEDNCCPPCCSKGGAHAVWEPCKRRAYKLKKQSSAQKPLIKVRRGNKLTYFCRISAKVVDSTTQLDIVATAKEQKQMKDKGSLN